MGGASTIISKRLKIVLDHFLEDFSGMINRCILRILISKEKSNSKNISVSLVGILKMNSNILAFLFI